MANTFLDSLIRVILVVTCANIFLPGCQSVPVPAIWPPNGELKPNNYIPPTTTPLPKLEFRYEDKEFCRNITEPKCQIVNKTRDITRCEPVKPDLEKKSCKPGKTIQYREKCEMEYNSKCTPVFDKKTREKCEDSYQAKCEEKMRVDYKTECVYTKDCHKNSCKQVKPVCRQVPVKRPVLMCSRQPKRICTQVMLPDIHKCEAPKQKCIQVPVEVENICEEEKETPKEICKSTVEEYQEEECIKTQKQVCETRQVKIPIIKTIGTTIPPQPFTTNRSVKAPNVTRIVPTYKSITKENDVENSSSIKPDINDVKDIEIGDEDIDQYYTKFQQ